MATRRQPLNLRGMMPGLFAATLLCAVALAAFLALWFSAPGAGWQSVFSDSYLWHVVRFSFWQASLSALISVGPAIFLARALYRRRFPGRTLLLRLCAMTLILPVLVAVFGILSVYGRQGWLASLFHALGWQWEFSPYGLQGILLAHVYFNMPMATRMVVDNSTVLANYFAISELTVGLTVVAIGTSLPELATAIAGARKGEDDIAIGNIIGANILNIALVLGLPALIAPGAFAAEAFTRDYGVMLLVSLIFAVLCWRRQQQPGRLVGALLVGGFVVWLAMLFWTAPLFVE